MQTRCHPHKRKAAHGCWLVLALATAACAPSPYLDGQMGEAVRTAMRHQTLGHDSGGPLISAAHQDGKAARSSLERYLRTFDQPPAALPGLIGRIGGVQGSGSL